MITLLLQGTKHREQRPAPLCYQVVEAHKAVPGNRLSFACSTENRSCTYGSGPDNTCQVEGEAAAAAVEELPSRTDGRGQRQFSGIWVFSGIRFFPNKKTTSTVLALKDLQPFTR